MNLDDEKILRSIQKLLETSLKKPFAAEDSIRACDQSLLSLLSVSPEVAREEAYKKLYEFPYKDVPECWRRLYTESCLWIALDQVEVALEQYSEHQEVESSSSDELMKEQDAKTWEIVEQLDKAIIMTAAPGRRDLIDSIFNLLAGLRSIALTDESSTDNSFIDMATPTEPAIKRRKHSHQIHTNLMTMEHAATHQLVYSAASTSPPHLRRPLPSTADLSLRAFQERLEQDHKKNNLQGPLPLIVDGAIDHWPAFQPAHSWRNPQYLFSKTLGGRRLVPIEIGRSYTDADWSQRIVTFREFMERYMLHVDPAAFSFPVREGQEDENPSSIGVGYLAQHDLFAQVPSLRADIAVPDYCYSVPPEAATAGSDAGDAQGGEGDVLVNAWFGPACTTTPLHTDPHHNVLAQVVGRKYVRLYGPGQTPRLYPRGTNELGIDMSNTSGVDLDEAMELLEGWRWDAPSDGESGNGKDGEMASHNIKGGQRSSKDAESNGELRLDDFKARFPNFADAEYLEGILSEGQSLFIPKGWWHYVRSLSSSFSVSFWWD